MMSRQLTTREIQILQHVAAGQTNKQIGTELAISPLTVKTHLERITIKLDRQTGERAGLIGHCFRTGLLT